MSWSETKKVRERCRCCLVSHFSQSLQQLVNIPEWPRISLQQVYKGSAVHLNTNQYFVEECNKVSSLLYLRQYDDLLVLFTGEIDPNTLLESREQHCRSRALSRRAKEAFAHNEGLRGKHSNHVQGFTNEVVNSDQITPQQDAQRERREREKVACLGGLKEPQTRFSHHCQLVNREIIVDTEYEEKRRQHKRLEKVRTLWNIYFYQSTIFVVRCCRSSSIS